jgi:hypothetical protein
MQSFQANLKHCKVFQRAAAGSHGVVAGCIKRLVGVVVQGGAFRQLNPGTTSAKSTGRPNPSVKGTSRKRAAPYVER